MSTTTMTTIDDNEAFSFWDRALHHEDPVSELENLRKSGLVHQDLPEVAAMIGFGDGTHHKSLWEHTMQVVSQAVRKQPIRWAALFHDVGKVKCFSTVHGKVTFHHHEAESARLFMRAAKRLDMPDDLRDKVRFLVANLGLVEGYDKTWTDSAVRRLTKDVGEHFEDLLALSRADITTKHSNKRAAIHASIHELSERARKLAEIDATPPALPSGLGDVLKERFGFVEGPELGKIMRRLKEEVEAGRLPRNAEFKVYIHALGFDP